MASLRASPFFQIEYLAKCKSQADCQRATERLQCELDVSKGMLACDEAMNKMIEVSTRCEILRSDEICAQEARARAEARLAEARLEKERAEGALAAHRAESPAKRRRIDSEASS